MVGRQATRSKGGSSRSAHSPRADSWREGPAPSSQAAPSTRSTPTKQHQQVCQRLTSALLNVVPDGYEVVSGWAWLPAAEQFVPDVMVTAATDETARYTGVPALVIEVLAGDRAADLVTKTTKFAAAGLDHFWVVDTADAAITCFVRDGADYRTEQVLTANGRLDFDIESVNLDVRTLLG